MYHISDPEIPVVNQNRYNIREGGREREKEKNTEGKRDTEAERWRVRQGKVKGHI
jgi:hypothetical protein